MHQLRGHVCAAHRARKCASPLKLSPGGGGRYRDPEFIKNGARIKTKGFKTDLLTDYALDFIGQNKDKPFFLAAGSASFPCTEGRRSM